MNTQRILQLKSFQGEVKARRLDMKKRMAIEFGINPRASYKVVVDEIDRQIAALQAGSVKHG